MQVMQAYKRGDGRGGLLLPAKTPPGVVARVPAWPSPARCPHHRWAPFTEAKEFIAGFTVPTQDRRPASALKSLRDESR